MSGDTLTCGVCRKEFALADIVKFIQHKVLTCNKENYESSKKVGAENGEATMEEASATEASNTTTTSITSTANLSSPVTTTTTLTRRHSISTLPEVKNLVAQASQGDNNNVKTERKVECVDAEANTVNSGKKEEFMIMSTSSSAALVESDRSRPNFNDHSLHIMMCSYFSLDNIVTVCRRQLVTKGHIS